MQRERTFYDDDIANCQHGPDTHPYSPSLDPDNDANLSRRSSLVGNSSAELWCGEDSEEHWAGFYSPIERPISLPQQYSPSGSPQTNTKCGMTPSPCPTRPRPCSPRRSRPATENTDAIFIKETDMNTGEVAPVPRPKSARHFRRRAQPVDADRCSVPPPEEGSSRKSLRPKSARYNRSRLPKYTSVDNEDDDLDLNSLNLNLADEGNAVSATAPAHRDQARVKRTDSHNSHLDLPKSRLERYPVGSEPSLAADHATQQVGQRVAAKYRRRASSDVTPLMRSQDQFVSKGQTLPREVKTKVQLPRKLRPIFQSVDSSPQLNTGDSYESNEGSILRNEVDTMPSSFQRNSITLDHNSVLRNPQSVQKTCATRKLKPLATKRQDNEDFPDEELGLDLQDSSDDSLESVDYQRPSFSLQTASKAEILHQGKNVIPVARPELNPMFSEKEPATRTMSQSDDRGLDRRFRRDTLGKAPAIRTKSYPR